MSHWGRCLTGTLVYLGSCLPGQLSHWGSCRTGAVVVPGQLSTWAVVAWAVVVGTVVGWGDVGAPPNSVLGLLGTPPTVQIVHKIADEITVKS